MIIKKRKPLDKIFENFKTEDLCETVHSVKKIEVNNIEKIKAPIKVHEKETLFKIFKEIDNENEKEKNRLNILQKNINCILSIMNNAIKHKQSTKINVLNIFQKFKIEMVFKNKTVVFSSMDNKIINALTIKSKTSDKINSLVFLKEKTFFEMNDKYPTLIKNDENIIKNVMKEFKKENLIYFHIGN